jgi:hypothetical protein
MTKSRFFTGDFDGDGKQDIIQFAEYVVGPDDSPNYRGSLAVLYRFNGSGFSQLQLFNTLMVYSDQYVSPFVLVGDFDGDGRTDLIVDNMLWVWNGSGFSSQPISLALTCGFYTSTPIKVGDFNGDGKADVACIENSIYGTFVRLFLSNGSGFVAQPAVQLPEAVFDEIVIGDFNGDGKADIAVMSNAGPGYANVYALISNGRTLQPELWATGVPYVGGVLAGDFDGDGRTDLYFPVVGLNTSTVLMSRGTYFAATPGPASQANGEGDFDGDGRSELLGYSPFTGVRFYAAAGTFPDLMTSQTNPWGGTTTIGYTPSSAFVNQKLPFVIQTATALTLDDGRGTIGTTAFAYSGGLWDSFERRFSRPTRSVRTMPRQARSTRW